MADASINLDIVGRDRNASSTFENVGEAAGQTGGKLSKFGTMAAGAAAMAVTGFAAAGAAVVAFGVVAGAQAMQVEKETDRLAAALGATPRKAAEFGKVASNLYAGAWGESMGEVTRAVEAVSSSFKGLGSGKELEKVTAQAMDFATIFEVDLPRATSVASTMIEAGLARNAVEALDLLTASAQKVPAALREDVLDAANEYGQFFSTIGMSGSQTMATLVAAAEKGEFGIDKMGDAVKEFTIRSTDMSTASQDAYKTLGLDAEEMSNKVLAGGKTAGKATQQIIDGLLGIKNPSEQANTAIALFGTPLEDLNVRDIPDFLRALKDGSKGLGDFGGAAQRASDTLNDNAATKLESFKRTAMTAVVDLMGTKVIPALERFGTFAATNLAPKIQALASEIGARLGPASEKVAIGFRKISPIIQQVGDVIATRVWPIMKGLAQYWAGTFVPAVMKLYSSIAHKMKPTFDELARVFTAKVLPAASRALKKFEEWRPTIQKVMSHVGRFIGKMIEVHFTIIGKVLPPLIRFAGFMLGKVFPVVGSGVIMFGRIIGVLISVGRAVGDAGQKFGRFAGVVRDKIADAIGWIKGLPGRAKSALGSLASTLYSAGQDLIRGMVNGVKAMASSLASSVDDVIDGAINAGKKKLGLGSPSKLFHQFGKWTMEGFANGLRQGGPHINKAGDIVMGNFAAELINNIVKDIDNKKVKLSDALARLGAYIKSRADKLKDVLGQRNEFAKGFLGFSPSVFQQDFTDAEGNSTLSVDAMIKFQKSQQWRAMRLANDVKKLTSRGLSDSLIKELQESGESGIAQIHELASRGTKEDIARLNKLNAQTDKALLAAGMTAGNELYGDQIRDIQRDKKMAQAIARELQKVLKGQEKDHPIHIHLEGTTIHTSLLKLKRKQGNKNLGLA